MVASPLAAAIRAPRQDRSQQTVQRVLDATLALLAEDGVEALTTNHIARRAGLSVAALYRFFPNKQAVIYAAFSRWVEALRTQVAATVAEWEPQLQQAPERWPEAAAALAHVLGESEPDVRVEYELLRAMWSHRELRDADLRHTRQLGAEVARLMACAGSRLPEAALIALATFANEQFTLQAQLVGAPDAPLAPEALAISRRAARASYLALWAEAMAATP